MCVCPVAFIRLLLHLCIFASCLAFPPAVPSLMSTPPLPPLFSFSPPVRAWLLLVCLCRCCCCCFCSGLSPKVNVDNNTVGFYQSMYLGSFCTQTLIDNQFSYQVRPYPFIPVYPAAAIACLYAVIPSPSPARALRPCHPFLISAENVRIDSYPLTPRRAACWLCCAVLLAASCSLLLPLDSSSARKT